MNLKDKKVCPEGCIYKIKEVFKPYEGTFRCYRILVALPNMDGNKPYKRIPAPSFARKYLLFETLDIQPKHVERIEAKVIKELRARGFTKIELVELYEERMTALMDMKPRFAA